MIVISDYTLHPADDFQFINEIVYLHWENLLTWNYNHSFLSVASTSGITDQFFNAWDS